MWTVKCGNSSGTLCWVILKKSENESRSRRQTDSSLSSLILKWYLQQENFLWGMKHPGLEMARGTKGKKDLVPNLTKFLSQQFKRKERIHTYDTLDTSTTEAVATRGQTTRIDVNICTHCTNYFLSDLVIQTGRRIHSLKYSLIRKTDRAFLSCRNNRDFKKKTDPQKKTRANSEIFLLYFLHFHLFLSPLFQ